MFTDLVTNLGHWDINWEGASSACFPGATGCTAAPTNTLELDSHFGGTVDVSRYGVDNLLFVYDSNSNDWAIAGLGAFRNRQINQQRI